MSAAALCLAACREKAPEPAPSADALARLAKGTVDAPKPPPLRLVALSAAELAPRAELRPACRLRRGNETLLFAARGAALAKVDGQLRLIPQAGPVDATGAFFKADGVTISIGGRPSPGGAAPAGVTIGTGGKDPPQQTTAIWGCSG